MTGATNEAAATTGIDVVVDPSWAGRRLDQVVAGVLDTSRNRAAHRIGDGDVTVDGVVRPRSHRLDGGERLVVAAVEAPPATPPPPPPPILHRGDDVLVVDKPAGLVVHPGHGHPDGTLVDALVAAGVPVAGGDDAQRPGIVHRLDKDTSGAMLVALSAAAHDHLTTALRVRDVTRSYVALVEGRLPATRGTIDVPLGRDPSQRTRFAAAADGRRSVTHFAVLADGALPGAPSGARSGARSGAMLGGAPVQLVACRLETGRTHQIRVHLAHAGAPVAGDHTYGAGAATADTLGLARPFLHALHLRFPTPTGSRVEVTAPLPDDLVEVLVRAGIDPSAADPAAIDWPTDAR